MNALRRRPPLGRLALDLTPMIDVVFQLLAFFCMTLRIATAEGDFNLLLPRQTGTAFAGQALPPHRVRLEAGPQGELVRVLLNDAPLAGPQPLGELRQRIKKIAGDLGFAEPLEVVLLCDQALHYQHAIDAVSAVSGEKDAQGNIAPLVTRLRLESPPPSASP